MDSELSDKAKAEPVKVSNSEHGTSARERGEERGRNPHHMDRPDRLSTGDRWTNWGEAPRRGGYMSRQRNSGFGGGGGDYRRRDRFEGRQEYQHPRGTTTRGEKWTHDLFQDANRSPTRKDEEDQIAKVEALLAS